MIRFVNLTDFYWVMTRAEDDSLRGSEPSCVKPVCAFLDTRTNTFLANAHGSHVCSDADDVRELEACNGTNADRCAGLVPDGFWET